jgi:hypothetical protein
MENQFIKVINFDSDNYFNLYLSSFENEQIKEHLNFINNQNLNMTTFNHCICFRCKNCHQHSSGGILISAQQIKFNTCYFNNNIDKYVFDFEKENYKCKKCQERKKFYIIETSKLI